MNFLNHPAFQSLVLPLVLAVLGIAALFGCERLRAARPGARVAAGPYWAPAGALLGLIWPMIWLTGLDWPAPARTQKLPWIVLAGLAVALWSARRSAPDSQTRPAGRDRGTWRATAVLWLLASFWLAGGQKGWFGPGLAGLAGVLVLALLAAAPVGVVTAAVLSVLALGLAALAAGGGSLLLAQLALMLVCSTAVPGLWAWLRPASGLQVPAWLLQPLGLAGLAMGWSWALSVPGQISGPATQLAVLALAFGLPLRLSRQRWLARHARWAPLAAACLAVIPAVLALALQFSAPAAAPVTPASGDSAELDDPYYTPR